MWRWLTRRQRRRRGSEDVVAEAERVVADAMQDPGSMVHKPTGVIVSGFPTSRYDELREGKITIDQFIDDLMAVVQAERESEEAENRPRPQP